MREGGFGYPPEMSTDLQDLQRQLATIERRIQSGVQWTATDGTSTTLNLQTLEREAKRLRSKIQLYQRNRPRVGRMRIWG